MGFDADKARLIMAEKCLTPAEVTRRAGLSNTTLYKALAGKNSPGLATIGKIAHAMNVSVKEIIKD